jgi:hypothetical protein
MVGQLLGMIGKTDDKTQVQIQCITDYAGWSYASFGQGRGLAELNNA